MENILHYRRPALLALLACLGPTAHAQLAPTYSNASLHGTYSLVSYYFDPTTTQLNTPAQGSPQQPPLGFSGRTATVTFDGAGNATLTGTIHKDGAVSASSQSFTYSVATNGAVTTSVQISGNLSDDGKIFLASDVSNGDVPQIIMIVRQEDSSGNTSQGVNALAPLTTGVGNTAIGAFSLAANTTGFNNAAIGYTALQANLTGANNTAFGANALFSNTDGKGNAAQGTNALYSNTTGIRNLGIGSNALFSNTTGSYNIALGFDAGRNLTTGSNNIEIGVTGTANDNNTIQIGVQGLQTSTTIAGIVGTPVTGSAVYVTSTGQLGVQASSERYKTDIATMPEVWPKLEQLRPVTFHYRNDSHRVPQYGLIAEEVDKVYPELVVRDDQGKIQGVHYEELAPMLLHEVQRLQHEVDDQQRQLTAIDELKQQVAELKRLNQSMQAALTELRAGGVQVAAR